MIIPIFTAEGINPMSHESVTEHFRAAILARICQMPEATFARAFGMTRVSVPQAAPHDFYAYRDNGASVLAVAHLDTVADAATRAAHFVKTEAGTVVYSRALDDRLGAYVILDLLPRLGITCDWLLTTGEEIGQSTAQYFDAPKAYDWIIEFDRGGTDVVMYQYDDDDTRELVIAAGATVGEGSFSDIAYLEHLGVKAFNWGIGYRDYHGARAHAYLADTFAMIERFRAFYAANAGTCLPHVSAPRTGRNWFSDDAICTVCFAHVWPTEDYCTNCGTCIWCEQRDCQCWQPSPAKAVDQ